MADKSLTIKDATDKELDELIIRLGKECQAQDLVAQLKRRSKPQNDFSYDQSVSTEAAIQTLYHYGVPGMRWARRRGLTPTRQRAFDKKDGHQSEKKPTSEDHNRKVTIRKKKVSEMSNAELEAVNKRLQLEKQYKDLTKAEKTAGQKFVSDVLTNAAKQTASAYTSKYMTKGVDVALSKIMKP